MKNSNIKATKKRILVVSNMYPDLNHPSFGIFVKNFCDQLEKLDVIYTKVTMYKAESKIQKLWKYIKFYFLTYFHCIFGKYDIVYIHYASHSSLPVILASKIKKLCIYVNVHGSDVNPENDRQEFMQKYTRRIIKISSKVIVPSTHFKEIVEKKYHVMSNKVEVSSSGGIDKHVFFKDANAKKANNVFTIGYVGRISYGKGWLTLLEAISYLDDINYKLIFVGNGTEKSQFLSKIEELHLESKIEMYDLLPQQQLCKIYNQLDVFVFPTEGKGESLGLVALEAMACGIPVIASDFAAPAYYVFDNYNGYKFEKGNATQLAKKLKKFYSLSLEEREDLSNGALQTAEGYYTDKVTEELKHILLEDNNGI